MEKGPEKRTEKGLAWQREFFDYLDGMTPRRLAGWPAAHEGEIVDDAATDSVAEEVEPTGVVEVADLGSTAVPASSGIGELDARLGGGFFPGLWMVVGRPGAQTTAFLESVAWEAVARHQAVIYYALTEGATAARERLLATVAFIMTDGVDDTADGRVEWRSDSEGLVGLDPQAWHVVLSRVWLADSLPGGPEPVGVFLRSLEHTLENVASRVGQAPVVLIDDLESLVRGLGVESVRRAARVVAGLNGVLARCGSPGLMTSPPELTALVPRSDEAGAKGLVQLGHGRLELASRSPERMDVTIHENPHAPWRGTLPLVLHPSVGLFTLAR